MNLFEQKIVGTLIVIFILVVFIQLTKRALRRFTIIKSIEPNRRKMILNFCYLLFYLIVSAILAVIWGVDIKQFTIFVSSILAVLGVAFVAQWSILSNLTASVILFFYHPLRIGDRIRILDKDFDWTGEVKDITGFYLFIITDKGERITLPNSLVIQKGIQMLEKMSTNEEEIEELPS